MNIETIQPHPLLQPYIDFYYIIRNDSPGFKSAHYSFPNTVNVLSIYKNASFKARIGHTIIEEDPSSEYLTLIQSKCLQPLKVELKGRINRISIFFKPLGINHFIDVPLSSVMNNVVNRFTIWDNDLSYTKFLNNSFDSGDTKEKIHHLECFLIGRLRPVTFGWIEKAIDLLTNFEQEQSIEEIISVLNIPNRTFTRRFKSFTGVSAVEYKSIARFRHSLNNKLFNDALNKLTDIGYNSNFYDQSYFIRMYKKLTGSNPTNFFNNVERLGNDKLIFQFLPQ